MAPQRKVVLIVDDDENIRSLLIAVLSDRDDLAITAVANGSAALAFLAAVRSDLILLDMKLAGLDGVALYRLIRERAGLETTPVLFLSGLSDAQFNKQTSALPGPFKILTKPFNLNDLDMLVDELLGDETN